ncbi:putative sugar lactone lactonase YvrE [Onthophagus taurus]|uniref:putative sugar lactone lactonase YvrE n=1 Tax=Onthophagus taurus TaxID=166361 RepID=UPI0039BE28B4
MIVLLILTITSLLNSFSCSNPCVTQVTKPVDHAEGPVWDYRTETLYYVDIHAGGLYSYHPKSNNLQHINLNGSLSVIIPSQSNTTYFFGGLNRTLTLIQWDGGKGLGKTQNLAVVQPEYPKSRFNDGKADKQGRLWFGTMGYENSKGDVDPNQGALYKFTKNNLQHPDVLIRPVNISNGLAWNKANDKFFYIDTPTNQVRQYDYDDKSGTISNPKIVFDVDDHPAITGHPDGMTIDRDDNLWVALYNGGAVIKVNPRTKKLVEIVPIPAQFVTSVAWGDTNFTTLYVTTSRYALNKEERIRQPAAGSVFAVSNTKSSGYPANFGDIINLP